MNMLDRLELLIGKENIKKLQNSSVLLIGVGGVGGYAAETLARSGIGNIILIDPDVVEETNSNRQLVALSSTLGKYKVEVMKDRMEDIGLNSIVTTYKEFITEENIDNYLENVDYVIDACDTLLTKLAIIKHCKNRQIPFISCMGTGNKMDPTKFEIIDLYKTSYDPLAKKLRKLVRDASIDGPIWVVASKEEKKVDGNTSIPSNAFVPGVAGMICASYVVNDIVSR